MTNIELYNFAYEFLLSKEGVTDALIKKHFQPEYNKPNDINTIYQRICETASHFFLNCLMSKKMIFSMVIHPFNSKKTTHFLQKVEKSQKNPIFCHFLHPCKTLIINTLQPLTRSYPVTLLYMCLIINA